MRPRADRCRGRGALAAALVALAGVCAPAWSHAPEQAEPRPAAIAVAPAVQRLIDAPYTTDEERGALRVFHGVWTAAELRDPDRRATAALLSGVWDDPSLRRVEAPTALRAEAALRRGEPEAAIALLEGDASLAAARVRTQALTDLGRFDDALVEAGAAEGALRADRSLTAPEIVDAVRMLRVRARLRGEPASGYQAMLDLLAQARRLDRLYWPAALAEAELLYEKDARDDAAKALQEVLSLNPRAADAWALLGRLHVDGFNMDAARTVAGTLDDMACDVSGDPTDSSFQGALIRARSWLRQNEPEVADEALAPWAERHPFQREGLAMRAAIAAVRYQPGRLEDLLALSDELSPGAPDTLFAVGAALSEARQYEPAAEYLRLSSDRLPNWPAPLIELGLLELQSGRDANALDALRRVAKLDPYNTRARNSLTLLEELVTYSTLEGDHFIVRYKPGVDEVLAREMLPILDEIHGVVATAIDHEPAVKTTLELMPNHSWFAVRITGMPAIHTIAAATGPVIAMETPRLGPNHSGVYDWVRVVRHEYVHTVTLSRTRNRIPHWFTEAAAVWLELAPRDYDTCVLLATALERRELFNLRDINTAFVRPKKPTDRAQAYAQGHWMYEFMVERFGERAPLELMDLYAQGVREEEAFRRVLGMGGDEFFALFLPWAGEQVMAWGLSPEPDLRVVRFESFLASEEGAEIVRARLRDAARAGAMRVAGLAAQRVEPIELPRPTIEQAQAWVALYPDHPGALEALIQLSLREREGVATPDMIETLERYARARPVDPTPHRLLAQLYLAGADPDAAIPHLEFLDAREQRTAAYAAALAQRYEAIDDLSRAAAKADRATTIAPYNAELRELAARIALVGGDLASAERHVWALTKLEPQRELHRQRLDRVRELRASAGE